MVHAAATLVSTLLFLVPTVVLLLLRAGRQREPWEVALDLPLALALDLLSVLALSRVVALETAVLVSRPAWIAFGLAWHRLVQRGAPRQRPAWLDPHRGAIVGGAGAVAFALSALVSRPYAIWDRVWHIPLVASLRGQRLPFVNVFEPAGELRYHLSGDVLAAELQALSFDVINSSYALSLAHDLLFALTAAAIVLLVLSFVGRRGQAPGPKSSAQAEGRAPPAAPGRFGLPTVAALVAAPLGVLLAGPVTALRSDVVRTGEGYSFVGFFQQSFRPHVSIAALLVVGLVGAVLVRLEPAGSKIAAHRTLPMLVGCLALLAITDEASTAVLGVALGVAWLVEPNVIHPERRRGLLVLVGLLATVLAPSFLLGGALGGGGSGPVRAIAWVAARSPGFYHPPLPLDELGGLRALLFDVAPVGLLCVALALHGVRHRRREVVGGVVFVLAQSLVAILLLTKLEVNSSPLESHRFWLLPELAAPLVAVVWLTRLDLRSERLVALLGLVLGAHGTLVWLVAGAPETAKAHALAAFGEIDVHQVDCRSEMGAALGERPVPTYADATAWYAIAGCRPLFAPGLRGPDWTTMKVFGPQLMNAALEGLDREMLAPGEPLRVLCRAPVGDEPSYDPLCRYLLARPGCRPEGSGLVQCTLAGGERAGLIAQHASPMPPSADGASPAAHFAHGTELARAGDLDAAIEQYRAGLALDGQNADAHYELGALCSQKGMADEADAELAEALALEPAHPRANAVLCRRAAARGDFDTATAHCDLATAGGVALPPQLEAQLRARRR